MRVLKPFYSVVLQEVPGEVSIAWAVQGCKQGCSNCSYKSLEKYGTEELTIKRFESILEDNMGLATCVVWMGGEWEDDFIEYLHRAKSLGYKNCLYTGMRLLSEVPQNILSCLDYCKVGKWEGKGLNDPDTNQKFWEVPTQIDMTYKFQQ